MPNLGVSAVVFDSRKILLIQRKDLEVWSLPGGFVDPEETVAQAAVREVAEETGVKAELTRMVGVLFVSAVGQRWRSHGSLCSRKNRW